MIETKMEHPPIETDPVAELEAYRAHMEAVQDKLNAELALEREARMAAEQDRDLARQELASARGAADQWKQNTTNMARRLKRDTEEFKQEKKELQEQIRQMSRRPVRVPVAGMAGTAVLAFLVAAAVEAQLVDHIIGEPLGYGCLVACGLFAGVLWERLRDRWQGRKTHGDRKIRGTQLGADFDRTSGRNPAGPICGGPNGG